MFIHHAKTTNGISTYTNNKLCAFIYFFFVLHVRIKKIDLPVSFMARARTKTSSALDSISTNLESTALQLA